MIEHHKVGDIEVLTIDDTAAKLLSKIVDQNTDVLEMNKMLIDRLSNPLKIVCLDQDQTEAE